MDAASQEKFTQNGQSSALDQVMSESNHENMGNHKSVEVVNGSPICVPEVSTVITSSSRKTISDPECGPKEIQPVACDPNGLENLEHQLNDASNHSNLEQSEANEASSSQRGKRKNGSPRKGEKMDFTGSPRVLRSRSQEKPKVPEPLNAPVEDAGSTEKKRKKKRVVKKDQINEFLKIKTHLRYLLSRMSYEQNFIDAYAGEGWKGQSLEKLRPEKELENAKSNIIRYKLKIRDLFQRMDTSCAEGRIPESLYDSEGLIDSEDIFCSKCGQTDVRLDNDIILCDGACERGFHQFCLEPPLLKEQVPPGDEGWLCPACDCKVDCVDLLNDTMGTHLSIGDSWEKVFPEAAASGNTLDDTSGLPSDDSEDDDYNPDGPLVEVEEEVDGEDSSSDESDFSSASEDLGAVVNKEQLAGLSSDDSEDDDFNPDGLGSDDEAKSKSSSSDFSSDPEDLGDINKNEEPLTEVEGPLMSEDKEEKPNSNMEDGDFSPITAKRRVERLDYKKLHDETYGNVSSDSSDEEFFDTEAPRRKNTKEDKENKKRKQSESTPIRTNKKLDVEGTSAPSDTGGAKSPYKRLGEAATQRLYESFKENRYPDRNAKENLAKELSLTHTQVNKWFDNARWSFNHPGTRRKAGKTAPEPSTNTPIVTTACKIAENNQPNKVTPERSITKQMNESAERSITKQLNESTSASPKSRKRKPKADHGEAEASPNQSVRRSGRSQSKH